MIDKLINIIKRDKNIWNQFQDIFIEEEIASKALLLSEGEISNNIYFIRKGCLRQWFNKDGKDITFQFFFEGQPVASLESFLSMEPSLFSIESIEPSSIISINKSDFEKLLKLHKGLENEFQNFVFQRFRNYTHLFLSRIKDSPQERYEDLFKSDPELIRRVPQHYIASYLGITSISLSRIRNRK